MCVCVGKGQVWVYFGGNCEPCMRGWHVVYVGFKSRSYETCMCRWYGAVMCYLSVVVMCGFYGTTTCYLFVGLSGRYVRNLCSCLQGLCSRNVKECCKEGGSMQITKEERIAKESE